MFQKFDAKLLWSQLLSHETARPTLLMGVPTVYVKMIEEYDKTYGGKGQRNKQEFVKAMCLQKMR